MRTEDITNSKFVLCNFSIHLFIETWKNRTDYMDIVEPIRNNGYSDDETQFHTHSGQKGVKKR